MLYVECKADETLVRILGLPRREISHELNKDEVLKQLAKQSRCLGMVDEDPRSPRPVQFGRMVVAAEYEQLGLRVYADNPQSNRVIVLRPRLEEWLTRAAQDAGLNLNNPRYNLPRNPVQLHQQINNDLRKLERLLTDLIAADAPRLSQLRSLLTAEQGG